MYIYVYIMLNLATHKNPAKLKIREEKDKNLTLAVILDTRGEIWRNIRLDDTQWP
jgi:hypothetical protein